MTDALWLEVIGLFIQTIVLAVSGTWLLSRALDKINNAIAFGRKEVDHSIATVENDLRDRLEEVDRGRRQESESLARVLTHTVDAIRERLHLLEIHIRENYVRRESFYKVSDEIKELVVDRFKTLDEKLERLSERRSI